MGHTEEGHKEFVQRNEGTACVSVCTGGAGQHSASGLGLWSQAAQDQLPALALLAL